MKTIITTIILGLSVLNLSARHLNSDLKVRSTDNSLITIVINNRVIHNPSSMISVGDLAPGRHSLKVIKHEPGYWNSVQKVVYNGMINIPRASVVQAIVGRNNAIQIKAQPKQTPRRGGQYGSGRGVGAPHAGYSTVRPNNAVLVSNPLVTTCATPPPPPTCMMVDRFQELKHTIASQHFDNSRLAIAKQAIIANGISADQVADLMLLITFESNRLELAKFAYAHTFDRHNYWVVNNAFTFSSSVRELDDFIYSFG